MQGQPAGMSQLLRPVEVLWLARDEEGSSVMVGWKVHVVHVLKQDTPGKMLEWRVPCEL